MPAPLDEETRGSWSRAVRMAEKPYRPALGTQRDPVNRSGDELPMGAPPFLTRSGKGGIAGPGGSLQQLSQSPRHVSSCFCSLPSIRRRGGCLRGLHSGGSESNTATAESPTATRSGLRPGHTCAALGNRRAGQALLNLHGGCLEAITSVDRLGELHRRSRRSCDYPAWNVIRNDKHPLYSGSIDLK